MFKYQRNSSACRAPVGGRINSCSCRSFLKAFALIFVVFCWQTAIVDAKRGCAKFGHSCYGGMGKRALFTSQHPVTLQDEVNPALVFTQPRSEHPPMSLQRLFKQNVHADKVDIPIGKHIPLLIQQMLRYYRNPQHVPVHWASNVDNHD